MDSQANAKDPAEQPATDETRGTATARTSANPIPTITIEDPDRNQRIEYESSSSTETEKPMSSRSSHHTSSSKGKHSSSSKSKSKKDDWSEITDPEERRRVQNRIAQRKFRDKAKETKESQERDETNRAHAGHSYNTPDPRDMGPEDDLSGLPWGSLSLRHVVSKGKAKEEESRRGSRTHEDRSRYDSAVYDERDAYHEQDSTYYEDVDRAYYSGSGHGSSSR